MRRQRCDFLAGTAGTVTLSGTVSPASITFDTDNYLVVNGTSSDSLLAGQAAIHQCAGGDGNDRLPIAGSGR